MIGQFIMISTALEKKVLLRFLLHIAIMTSLLVMMVFVWTLVIGKSLKYQTVLFTLCNRCNSDPGCFDLSDEFDCKIINPGKSYQSFIAPPPISDTGEKKVQIDISADIISILDIDEISSIFQVQFFLYFSWHDPRYNNESLHFLIKLLRLIFYNLKSDIGLNALSPEEKQQIWVPKLLFSNTENKLE